MRLLSLFVYLSRVSALFIVNLNGALAMHKRVYSPLLIVELRKELSRVQCVPFSIIKIWPLISEQLFHRHYGNRWYIHHDETLLISIFERINRLYISLMQGLNLWEPLCLFSSNIVEHCRIISESRNYGIGKNSRVDAVLH